MDWLTATADASARAGHDFYKIIMYFTMFDCFDQFTCVSESADNSSTNSSISKLDLSFYNTWLSTRIADNLECIRIRVTSGYKVVSRTKCCFHNTTCCSEDNTGTGPFFHQRIAFTINQRSRINMCRTDHACQFTSCKYNVCLVSGIFTIEQFHVTFAFFGNTWHDRYSKHIFRFHTDGFCKIALHNRTEHLLW